MKRGLRFLILALLAVALVGCYVHGRPYHRHGGPPPPEGQPYPEGQPQPEAQPQPVAQPQPEGEPVRVRAPAAPDQPMLTVSVSPSSVRRGEDTTVFVQPYQTDVTIYYNGRVLPKRVGANAFTITIPADGTSGYVEVEWGGRRFRSGYVTVVD